MDKFKRKVLFFARFLIFAGIAYALFFYMTQQSQQREIQDRILNNSFAKVQPQNGKVLFDPSHRGMPMQILGSTWTSFDDPKLLSVGSQLRIGDEHFLLQYKVSQIEADGVTIAYEADGGEPSPIRRSHGAIKLNWK